MTRTLVELQERAPLKELRQSLRNLKASVTNLRRAIARARYRDALELEAHKLEQSIEELGRRIGAERDALDEPHRFQPPGFGIWCGRCGGTKDRTELHPPEMQVHRAEVAARV